MLPGESRQQWGIEQSAVLIQGRLGVRRVGLSTVAISRVRVGGISSPELEEAQGVVSFPVQGLVSFGGKVRDCCVFLSMD